MTGRIERGIVKVGEEIEIVGISETRKKVVTGVEMFKKLLDEGQAGDNVGVLLRGTERTDVQRGYGVWRSRARSRRTRSSRRKSTFCRKKRAAVTRRFSTAIGRSSTSGRRT